MSELTVIDNSIISIGGSLVQVVPSVDPYNPLGLPPFTVRVRYVDGVNIDYSVAPGATNIVHVSESPNIWDLTRENPDWHPDGPTRFIPAGNYGTELKEILGANSTGVTNMNGLFAGRLGLQKVALFDTSSVTDMGGTFYDCESLLEIPLFDTSSCTNMKWMFRACFTLQHVPLFDTRSATNVEEMFEDCSAVQSGALALYQRMSSQETPPENHSGCFKYCGRDTVTGAAELAQIPKSWGGTLA